MFYKQHKRITTGEASIGGREWSGRKRYAGLRITECAETKRSEPRIDDGRNCEEMDGRNDEDRRIQCWGSWSLRPDEEKQIWCI